MLKLTLKRGDAVHLVLADGTNLGYTCQKTLRSLGRNRHSPHKN